ncbi:hypothetical protein [Paraflavitalea pollutisoli]|uniref:hypothetical protein n=1 Tax=Paraflavitalea pollutisoli TaxID=3034143 RepID=UPI0023ED8469|nr:hypothetical protein [Paraflavitalea sp. H1-2-19X]
MKWQIMASVAIVSLCGYVACIQAKVQQKKPVITKRLVRWQSTGDSASATQLTKDTAGHITLVENNTEINTFRYVGDSILLTEYAKEAGRVVYSFRGLTDSTGKLLQGTAIAAYGSFAPDTVLHRFEYNKEGYLVRESREYGAAGTYTISYEYDGRDVVRILTWYNNELNNTKELGYYSDKANTTGLEDLKFRHNINNLVGRNSEHLIKTISSANGKGKLNYAFTYEYETDAEGLPVKLIAKKGKQVKAVTTYYYAAG